MIVSDHIANSVWEAVDPCAPGATRTKRRRRRYRPRREVLERVSTPSLLNALSSFFPGNSIVWIRVGFRKSQIEILPLLGRERKRVSFLGNTVPELLDELELLYRRELEQFLAKGILCH